MFAGLRFKQMQRTWTPLCNLIRTKQVAVNPHFLRYLSTIINIKLPDLGEGTKEATLKEWFVEKGSEINEFEDLCEVFTDKLVAQIPSTHKGIVKKLYYKADDICPVGSTLADIEIEEDGESSSHKASASESSDEEELAKPVAHTDKHHAHQKIAFEGSKALATPATRHYAKEKNVDISKVKGTGKDGRVLDSDIDNFLAAPAPKPTSKPATHRPAVHQEALKGVSDLDKVKKITAIKKGMTKTMTESLSIPFFTYQDEYDCTALMKLRKDLKTQFPKLTLLPFFIKALSLGMRNHPGMNINVNPDVDEEGYIYEYVIKHDHNFAIAVDSAFGLVVPVVKNVQSKSIIEINQECIELRDKAAAGKLLASDYEGGTFSVSSVGNLGGTTFVPTILRPQGSIVAIGKAKKTAHYVETNANGHVFEPRDYIGFSYSCDHRVIDGATCARFSEDVRKLIENPQNMLLNMN